MRIYDFEGSINSDWEWQDFGRELAESQDLDPLYVMLVDGDSLVDDDMLKRWLLAYSCYYHTGVASIIAERPSNEFYDGMWDGIENRWPRGMERRYFWGKQADNILNHLESLGSPEGIIDNIADGGTFEEVNRRTQELVGYGPWMGWKMADLIDRVLGIDVDFSNSTLGIYKDPKQGAALVMFGDWRADISVDQLQDVVVDHLNEFNDLLAPPYYDRPINIQEVETMLCNFKAHHKGYYPMGNDTYHMSKALDGWGDLAESFKAYIPPVQDRWLSEDGKVTLVRFEDYYE